MSGSRSVNLNYRNENAVAHSYSNKRIFMNLKFNGLFVLLVVSLASCMVRNRQNSDTKSEKETAPESLISKIISQQVDVSKVATVNPADLFLKVGEAVKVKWLKSLIEKMPVEVWTNREEEEFKKFIGTLTAQDIDGFLARLGRLQGSKTHVQRFVSKPSNVDEVKYDLNQFPTLPLELVPDIQRAILLRYHLKNLGKDETTSEAQVPVQNASKLPAQINLSKDCQEVRNDHETLVANIEGVGSLQERVEKIKGTDLFPLNPCYGHNSEALANLLNQIDIDDVRQKLNFKIGEASYEIADVRSVVSALLDSHHDFRVDVYAKRVWVDFTGWVWRSQDQQTVQSIRSPIWFSYPKEDGSRVALPGEHSEVGILVYRNKNGSPSSETGSEVFERVAHIKFYAGVATQEHPRKAAFWRAKVDNDHSWAQPELEFAKTYISLSNTLGGEEGSRLDLENFLSASLKIKSALQGVLTRFELPKNGYGVFVCNDSVALLLGLWDSLRSDEALVRRSSSFPLVRLDKFVGTITGQLNTVVNLNIEERIYETAQVTEEYFNLYPSDSLVARDVFLELKKGAQDRNSQTFLRSSLRFNALESSERFIRYQKN